MTSELQSMDDSQDQIFINKDERTDTVIQTERTNEFLLPEVGVQRPPIRKKQRPLVSVIIPVYNGEKFIIKAVQSVIAQTYENLELTIVNDGSTDNTMEVFTARYAGETNIGNVKNIHICHKENGGTASAFNMGIKASNGEYIKWLSADDELYPHAITDLIMLGVEDYGARSHQAIFYTDYDIIDENDNIIGEFREPARNFMNQEAIVDELFGHFFGNGSSSLIHKNVFAKCGLFDESFKHSEDYEFWLRATALFGINMIHIPIKSIKYRRHKDMLTNTFGGSNDEKIRELVRSKMVQIRR